ncbi:MAG: C40 family peptidase [Lachnospiraceae bacterium]|nr:C40 family peptidase [Lachnospiraceae bacterium]
MYKRALCFTLALIICFWHPLSVSAATKNDAIKQKQEAEKNLDSVNSDIDDLSGSKEELESEIAAIDEELVDLLLAVDIIDGDISEKKAAISEAEAAYEEAKAREESQYNAMKRRIKFMYEKGDNSYMELLMSSQSISDLVNKSDYVERLYVYDRQLLLSYQETKEEVLVLKEKLETELHDLEELQDDYLSQSEELKAMIAEKQETVENFEEQLDTAREKAAEYTAQIKEQTAVIKKIEAEEAEAARKKAEEEKRKKAEEEARKKAEEEARKKAEEEAKKKNETVTESTEAPAEEPDPYSEESPAEAEPAPSQSYDPGNSSKGQEIANFALQYVGYPYVSGGTSLTEGCDCSGFTSAVFANFGISLPRTSYSQSTAGREVSYASAQPGDIIYYGGHVGIYIGNGQIVHASTAATGIKISNALYRSIITVRRFV